MRDTVVVVDMRDTVVVDMRDTVVVVDMRDTVVVDMRDTVVVVYTSDRFRKFERLECLDDIFLFFNAG
jgi:hypothetical protein